MCMHASHELNYKGVQKVCMGKPIKYRTGKYTGFAGMCAAQML